MEQDTFFYKNEHINKKIHTVHTFAYILICMQMTICDVCVVNLHSAGWGPVPGAARLLLLQLRALGAVAAHRELAHPPGAHTLALGSVGVVALLGAGRPVGPTAHLTVLGYDAGLVGHRQAVLGAQTGFFGGGGKRKDTVKDQDHHPKTHGGCSLGHR